MSSARIAHVDDATVVAGADAAWRRPELLSALQTAVDAVVVAGFGFAGIVGVCGGDAMRLVVGSGRVDALEASRQMTFELSRAEAALALGERRDGLVFVPAGRLDHDSESMWVAPEAVASDDPQAWQPGDQLYADVRTDAGTLVGVLSVDLPLGGRRPGPEVVAQLAALAVLAGRSMLDALEAQVVDEARRASAAARSVVRRASAATDEAGVIDETLAAVVEEFAAAGAWIRTTLSPDVVHVDGGFDRVKPLPRQHLDAVVEAGERCWKEQQVLVMTPGRPAPTLVEPRTYRWLVEQFHDVGLGSMMMVPIGASHEYLGYLMIVRAADDDPWSVLERDEALAVGLDVGRALLNVRTFARERQLVEQLKRMAGYRAELVSSFSHELQTPLAAIGSQLELLEMDVDEWPTAGAPIAAVRRSADRLGRLVDDLVHLSRLSDDSRLFAELPVDLRSMVALVIEEYDAFATKRGVTLDLEAPAGSEAVVAGDVTELAVAVSRVVRHALLSTPQRGSVVVQVATTGSEGRVVVTDEGASHVVEDQTRAADFFRSAAPSTLELPGSGLGLRLAEQILERHGGSISVVSSDAGNAFTMSVPLHAED